VTVKKEHIRINYALALENKKIVAMHRNKDAPTIIIVIL